MTEEIRVAAAISAEEDYILRKHLLALQFSDSVAANALTSTQTASLLYRSGHKRAAKELLCEQRDSYDEFKRTASPCLKRADWELRGELRGSDRQTANAPMNFRPNNFRSQADCLTAAAASGTPLSACSR